MIADEIREARERLGLSQEKLAKLLDPSLPGNTVARWERGELEVRHPGILRRALRDLEREAGRRRTRKPA